MAQPILAASLGKRDPATITRTWRGTFSALVEQLLKKVPVTEDKASPGWICGAEFSPEYRHSEHFKARHLLSLDYDHIKPEDVDRILSIFTGTAFLAYTTWSHAPLHPRLRVWVPLSRPVGYEEFQALSRRVAARGGIELAARESHTPAQFMFRPASKAGVPFQHWEDTESPYLDVDKVLGEYDDWTDRKTWPHRADGDSCHSPEAGESPLDKPGVVGEFCRAYRIADAIERFGLPYKPGSTDGRWTYTAGSRADGAVSYDDDTKLHSHHDTDPARGQHNAYDLVRLHRFGAFDEYDGPDVPIADRESSRFMEAFAAEQPEIAAARLAEHGFADLDATEGPLPEVPGAAAGKPGAVASGLPPRIVKGIGRETDLSNARRIQHQYGDRLICIGKIFYVWCGTHWVYSDPEASRLIANLSAMVGEEAVQLKNAGDEEGFKKRYGWAILCSSAQRIAACENLLRKHLDFKAENLNVNRGLLTCRSGTIDLRSGTRQPHSPRDFITACAPVEFDPSARAPRFELFLREIFKGDESLVGFAKRWFGYCITGEVLEHALVFHIGEGGNGKGKLMTVLQHVLGPDYAGVGARGLLTGGSKGASPEIADLLGRRMVTLSETNQDEEFDPGILKELTGGDRLKARNLYEGYIEFNPTHKLQVFTNYEPRITGQDRGIWRRLFLLNYNVKYGRPDDLAAGNAQELQDDKLDVKLAAEAQGIFAWLVEGAREWYARGLQPPPAVLKATEDFKARQDLVGQFLKERTIRDPDGSVPLTNGPQSLLRAYKGWAEEMGYRPMGRNKFAEQVRRAALYAVYDPRDRVFRGLRLTSEAL